jgi:hypothetical protein
MSITHEQAHHLIQLEMEDMLNSKESALLSAHLRECRDCAIYVNEIREVTNLLAPVMKRRWSVQPAPLSVVALMGRKEKITADNLLTMRKAAIALLFVALFLSTWQFERSGGAGSGQSPLIIPSAPTPLIQNTQSTSTESTQATCDMIIYLVQGEDTLASIAEQFSTSEREIIQLNQLKTATIGPPMELSVPVCNFTPTGTYSAVTFTTTYTPLIIATTSTPLDRH